MADGTTIKNATGATVTAATDELSDGQFSPKVSLLDGSTSPIPISPATAGGQAAILAAFKAEDAIAGSGDLGIQMLAVRKDTAASTSADGDYHPLEVDANGRLHTTPNGNVAAAATDSGNPIKTGGIYTTTTPTLTDGQRGNTQIGVRGAAHVQIMSADSTVGVVVANANSDTLTTSTAALAARALGYFYDGSQWVRARGDTNGIYVAGYSRSHISTATTTTVKSGAGVLHSIVINTKGTVASTITVYDNTAGSGTVIAVIDSLTPIGALYLYDVLFTTGLTLVTTGTVAPDVTVAYR